MNITEYDYVDTYKKWRTSHPSLCEFIVKHLKLDSSQRILEVGCGPGFEAREIIKYSNASYFGVDILFRMIQALNSNPISSKFMVGIQAKAEALPFLSDTFDAVLFILSLHQMNDKKQIINEAGRILKRHGSLVIVIIQEKDWVNLLEYQTFPGLKEIERNRSISVESIKKIINGHNHFGYVHTKRIIYENRFIDLSHIERLRAFYFSSLKLLDKEFFDQGLEFLESKLEKENIIEEVCCTIITTKKD